MAPGRIPRARLQPPDPWGLEWPVTSELASSEALPHRVAVPRSRPSPVPPVVQPGVRVLFVGINPCPTSARVGHHFANPRNTFWRLLHESGFTPRQVAPAEELELVALGLGLTNIVPRSSPSAAALDRDDLARGRARLERLVRRVRPAALVFVGVTAYRAFAGKRSGAVECGERPEGFGGARLFVLPNPSGRNAHFTYAGMLERYRAARRALEDSGVLAAA